MVDFLDVMLKYRCRILFTTRSRYENQISLEVKELPEDVLIAPMGKFYDVEKKIGIMEEIITSLHGHTYAVELTAHLLSNGMLKPKALLKKLQEEKPAMNADDKTDSNKGGRNKKVTKDNIY